MSSLQADAEHRHKLEVALAELEALKEQMLQEKAANHKRQQDDRKHLEEVEAELREKNKKIDAEHSIAAKLQAELDSAMRKLEKVSVRLAEVTALEHEKEHQLLSLGKRVSELEPMLKTAKDEARKEFNSRMEMESIKTSLEDETKSQAALNKKQKSYIDDLLKQINELTEQVHQLQADLATTEKKFDTSSKREKQRHAMNQELNTQHDETIEHLHEVEEKLKTTERNWSSTKDELKALLEKIAELTEELEEAQDEVKNYEHMIEIQEESLRKKIEETKALKAEVVDTKQNASTDHNDLNNVLIATKKELERLQKKTAQVQEELEVATASLEASETPLSDAGIQQKIDKLAEATMEVTNLTDKMSALTTENKTITQEKNNLAERLEAAERKTTDKASSQVTEATEKASKLGLENRKLESKVSDLEKSVADLTAESTDAKEKVASIGTESKEAAAELAKSKSVAEVSTKDLEQKTSLYEAQTVALEDMVRIALFRSAEQRCTQFAQPVCTMCSMPEDSECMPSLQRVMLLVLCACARAGQELCRCEPNNCRTEN